MTDQLDEATRAHDEAPPLTHAAAVLRAARAHGLHRYAAVAVVMGALVTGYVAAAGGFRSALTPAAIVDRQEGPTPFAGFRRAHAKGICVEGVFRSTGTLADRSVARLFGVTETPFVGRFSIGGNNPTAPDLAAGVRSLALDFRLANGERWRTAMNINPVLAVRDVEAFHDQLAALAPDAGTGRPSAARLAAFFDAHPESAAFRAWQRGYAPSGSFATESYHAINAFLLVDASGGERAVRWSVVPLDDAGANPFTDADALQQELVARLERAPVRFQLRFVFAGPGDDISDPSSPWPAEREQVDAGLLEIRSASPQAGGACNGINFDPLVLPRGIAPSPDPILHARSAAYAVSQRRRAAEAARAVLP